ncbi:MAG: hypothetical protein QNJ62_11825 [Methyloceanibacter sp.]|nr:hypothetical protein [Methyloceanibacter sp.]
MRNTVIAGVVAVAIYGAMHLGSNSAGMMLVDSGHSGLAANTPVWVLATIVAAAIYSFCRETTVSVPPALEAWASDSKTWLFAGSALLVLAACALA